MATVNPDSRSGFSVAKPALDETIETPIPSFGGRGEPGATVEVAGNSGRVYAWAVVDEQGDWVASSTLSLDVGKYVATARHALGGILTSAPIRYEVVLPTTLHILEPALDSVVSTSSPVFAGAGVPGASIEIRGNSGRTLAATEVLGDGTWAVRSAVALGDGPYIASATQIETGRRSSVPIRYSIDSALASNLNDARSLVSASGTASLARDLAARTYPNGVSKAVVVANDAQLIAEAAPIAETSGAALVIADSMVETAGTRAQLSRLGVTDIVLYGVFSDVFKAGLGASAISLHVSGTTPFKRTTQAAGALPRRSLVVGSTAVANSVQLGSSLAILAGSIYVVLSGDESETEIRDFFASRGDYLITIVGDEATLPIHLLPALDKELYALTSPADATKASLNVALDYVREGARGSSLWTAPIDQPGARAIAELAAKRLGAAFAPAGATGVASNQGAAQQYASAWASELSSVVLAGVDVTDTQLDRVIAGTALTRDSAPQWTVKDVRLEATTYTYELLPRPGAVTYKALTINGETVATSSSTTLTVPGLPGTVTAIAAFDAAGKEVDSMPTRINQYQEEEDRASALVATVRDGGRHHLNWLGGSKVPRMLTRYAIDIFADDPMNPTGNPSTAEIIAITCEAAFTTAPQDMTKQWVYQVETLATTSHSCGGDRSQVASGSGSGISIPLLKWPDFAARMSPQALATVPLPGLTVADMALGAAAENARVTEQAEVADVVNDSAKAIVAEADDAFFEGDKNAARAHTEAKSQTRGPGDDMAIMRVFYTQDIPERYVPFPLPSGDLGRPATAFGGDHRDWWDLWGSNRAWNMSEVHFGSGAKILNYREMGTTHKYKCSPLITSCIETESATEHISGIGSVVQAGETRAVVGQFVTAKNPLVSIAPPIDGVAYWDLKRGGSSVKAQHDMMPRHQLWYGNAWAQAWLAWQSPWHALPCLYGAPARCIANVNVAI
ncbi:Ig-like domain-containing protein [Leifsonia lichenia]